LAELALNLDQTFQDFGLCRNISATELEKDIKKSKLEYGHLQRYVDKMDKISSGRLQEQVEKIGKELDRIHRVFDGMKNSFDKMATYFGESTSSSSCEQLFGILDDFLQEFSKAKKKISSKKGTKRA